MDPASLALAERSAPRYTSYPTAPHFSKSIGDDDARAWLANLDRFLVALALFPRSVLHRDLRLLRLSHQGGAPGRPA